MSPLRLAYVCADPGIPIDGHKGASVHFRELAGALRALGVQVDGYAVRGGPVDGFRVVDGHGGQGPARGVPREVSLMASSMALAQDLAAGGPHDAVYERLSLFSVTGMAYASAQAIPLVVEVNAPLWHEAARYRTLHLSRTAQALALDTLMAADRVLVVSSELGRQLVKEGVDASKITVLWNGVNADVFAAAPVASRPPALLPGPVLTFVGSLKPWHGVEFLLAAFAALRDAVGARLWVVGDGPLRADVEAAVARYPGEIVCEGAVPHARIASILKASDVALAPYPADAPAYFCPLKVIEALALGVPLVASRVPCVEEVARGHSGAHLFRADDAGSLIAAVQQALGSERPAHPPLQSHAWSARAAVVEQLVRTCRAERVQKVPSECR